MPFKLSIEMMTKVRYKKKTNIGQYAITDKVLISCAFPNLKMIKCVKWSSTLFFADV